MEYKDYQVFVNSTARETAQKLKVIYPCLGLAGELGEVIEHVKKVVRDREGKFTDEEREKLKDEIGDVLWYLTRLCSDLDISLVDVILCNVKKLEDRVINGK